MISRLGYYESTDLNPYRNLSVEEYLLNRVGEDEVIMYLWRNRHTVVVGRNQNIWNECNVVKLKESGGFPARRLSGGGAVYHDAGNLNFTFLAVGENYSVECQTDVITQAMRRLGFDARKNGRNDICIDGRKFSGNAFYENGDRCFHHGTILIRTDVEEMNRFLNVPVEKLQSKGVASVRSRVVNLSELNNEITACDVKKALLESFESVYGLSPNVICDESIDEEVVESLSRRYGSDKWLYNKSATFSCEVRGRFDWGGAELSFDVANGVINQLSLFTDSLETDVFDRIRSSLTGCVFMPSDIGTILQGVARSDAQRMITADIAGMIKEKLFD